MSFRPRKTTKGKRKVKRKSEFNAITSYLGVFAMVIEFVVGFRFYNSPDPTESMFGTITMLEGGFALFGLLLIDLVHGHGFRLKPKNEDFRKIDDYLGLATNSMIILIVIFVIQFLTIFIPLTVSNFELGLGIIFASICEELFFRGLILGIVKNYTKEAKLKRYIIFVFTFSFIEIIGILLSSLFFSLIHVNYYESPEVLIGIFLGGIALSVAFFRTDDLTPLMFAHLFLNIYSVYQVLGISGLLPTF